jgi:hypothetical protein
MAAPGRALSKRQAAKVEKNHHAVQTQRSLERIRDHFTKKPELVPTVLGYFAPVPQQRAAKLEEACLLLAWISLLAGISSLGY